MYWIEYVSYVSITHGISTKSHSSNTFNGITDDKKIIIVNLESGGQQLPVTNKKISPYVV